MFHRSSGATKQTIAIQSSVVVQKFSSFARRVRQENF